MSRRTTLLLLLVMAVWAASGPVTWTGTTLFDSSKGLSYVVAYTVTSSAANKSYTAPVTWTTPYTAVPKLFYGIFKIATAIGNVETFDVILAAPSQTGFTINYTSGASTSVNSLRIYILSFLNNTSTSFMSVGCGVAFTPSLRNNFWSFS